MKTDTANELSVLLRLTETEAEFLSGCVTGELKSKIINALDFARLVVQTDAAIADIKSIVNAASKVSWWRVYSLFVHYAEQTAEIIESIDGEADTLIPAMPFDKLREYLIEHPLPKIA